jgi:hypothetical protein
MPVQLALTLPEMTRLDLTDEEREELVQLLHDVVENDRFQLSLRVRRLRRILAKLREPPQPPADAGGRTR